MRWRRRHPSLTSSTSLASSTSTSTNTGTSTNGGDVVVPGYLPALQATRPRRRRSARRAFERPRIQTSRPRAVVPNGGAVIVALVVLVVVVSWR